MPLRLYNTRTRSVETFAPLHDGRVRIYVCGLTPSAQAHVGHARSFLFFDVLRRFLIFRGYDVTYVQNVTDIDDRSINRARETGEHWYDIVSSYYASFKASMRRLGVAEPDFEPYATKYVEPMVEMIVELIETGHAYSTDDGVYYRVASFVRYGALANRNLAELQSGARIDIDEKKDDPLDFALWKFAKPGEPSWPSPWGEGRPGWHIECSAMAHALLDPQGEGFDIHGGGADLIFPHHENEIAQSEPLMARPPMANFWMHGGLLLFENKKMSKSLGNFEPLSDLLERHDPLAIRLLFLQTGYRKVMNFTEESIAAAGIVLEKLKKAYRELHTVRPVEDGASAHSLLDAIERALEDDMNTSVALAELLNVAASASSFAADAVVRPAIFARYVDGLDLLGLTPDDSWLQVQAALPDNFVAKLEAALGRDGLPSDPQAAVDAVIGLRAQARAQKNWSESDRLRDGLLACGVELKDSKDGTAWIVAQ